MNKFNRLSIVIPVGPGDRSWRHLLSDLAVFGDRIEIVLSACEAQPDDFELPAAVRWLQGARGRAQQLNAGARATGNRFIWFLHADSRLTIAVAAVMARYLQTDGRRLGYFRLRFASDGPILTRLNAWAANRRSRWFGLPFGDQGLIVERSVFEHLTGFDEAVSLGEDLDFVVRARAAGFELRELPAELITSARRYRQCGWLATTFRHIWLTWRLTREASRRLALT